MEPGAWIVMASGAAAVVTALVLRPRVPSWAVGGLLAVAGGGIGWGGMLLQPHPSDAEVAIGVVLMAALAPAHARVVLGPFGPRKGSE